jgi:uncharacterized membrane protein YesL
MDDPQKKGLRRFAEILFRDFWDLIRLNLLFCACMLPSAALFAASLFGLLPYPAFLLSLAAAFPAGGACCACFFCITKMLRDDPGYLWHTFKRKFRENIKQAMAPGVCYATFLYAQIYLWVLFLFEGMPIGAGGAFLSLVSLLAFGMVAPYIFLLAAYIDLPMPEIVKNSLLLAFANAPRSFAGALSGGVIWLAFALLSPASLTFSPFLFLFGFSMSWLANLMWIWLPVDRQFAISETLKGVSDGSPLV